jgi:hypothetical protein
LKTWWAGDWADQQYPDGTVVVTSPTGKSYTTKPVASLLFSGWNTETTASPPRGAPPIRPPGAGTQMAKRKRTRAQDHAYRIRAERERNAALIADAKARATKTKAQLAQRRAAAAHNEPHSWETHAPTNDDDPPPF